MKKNTIGIIGLGYVGLPLLLLLNKLNFQVYGFDISEEKIKLLKKNISYNSDISSNKLKKLKKNKIFTMNSISEIKNCDFIIICLPTPLTNNKPDMSYIEKAFNDSFEYLRKKQTIILESSVYPGATIDIFVNKLSRKFSIGKNFFLAYSPERIDPGHPNLTPYENITKLVSGYSKNCEKKIVNLYKRIFKKIYLTSSVEVAEFAKLFENTFRSVNIGLVNEMKMLADKMKINIHQVISAAKTKPFGFKAFRPGPGLGGHCIPIDPVFISWVGKKIGFKTQFINLGVKTNKNVSDWIIDKIINFNKKKKIKNLLMLGIAYKANVNDYRESPAVYIFKKLKINYNFKIDYYDPFIPEIKINNKLIKSIPNIKKNILEKYDAIAVLTDHKKINFNLVLKNSKIIYDTRGVFQNVISSKVIHL